MVKSGIEGARSRFAPKGAPSFGLFLFEEALGAVIQRNHAIGELTGIVTPGMVHSSRLAARLQSQDRLPREVSAAAAAGLATGGKAIVNGSATAIKTAATLGL
jgi:hypothetical protein